MSFSPASSRTILISVCIHRSALAYDRWVENNKATVKIVRISNIQIRSVEMAILGYRNDEFYRVVLPT